MNFSEAFGEMFCFPEGYELDNILPWFCLRDIFCVRRSFLYKPPSVGTHRLEMQTEPGNRRSAHFLVHPRQQDTLCHSLTRIPTRYLKRYLLLFQKIFCERNLLLWNSYQFSRSPFRRSTNIQIQIIVTARTETHLYTIISDFTCWCRVWPNHALCDWITNQDLRTRIFSLIQLIFHECTELEILRIFFLKIKTAKFDLETDAFWFRTP